MHQGLHSTCECERSVVTLSCLTEVVQGGSSGPVLLRREPGGVGVSQGWREQAAEEAGGI